MKKMLFTAVSALAIAGVAVAADSTQFGVLKVPSSATNTIVSVPWLASGTGSDDVKVADLVLTAGLKEGDELRLYDGNQMSKSWRLTSGKWVGGNNVVSGDTDVKNSGNDQTGIARGKALMLVRTEPDNPACFYIMGKPASSESGSTTILGGSAQTPAYSLIAPAKTTATKLSALTFSDNLTTMKEYIYMRGSPVNKVLTYVKGKSDAKGKWYNSNDEEEDAEIPAGEGVWFMSRSTGDKTVSW